jgi:PAS domain S-box-containing protein
VALALFAWVALGPVGDRPPFLLLTGAVLASAWYGGLWPGLLATLAGAVLAGSLAAPGEAVDGPAWGQRLPLLGFVLQGGLISALGGRLRQADRRGEERLRQSEALNRDVLASLLEQVAVIDREGNVLAVNEPWHRGALEGPAEAAAGSLAGVAPGANYLAACRQAAPDGPGAPGDGHALQAVAGIEAVLAGALPHFELEYSCGPDADRRWFRLAARPLRRAERGAVLAHADISARKQAELARRESQERLRLMADSLPVLISFIDAEQRYRFNNAAYESWFGVPPEAYQGRHVREVIGDAAYEVVRGHVEAALAGRPQSFEGRLNYTQAGTRHVHIDYVPHHDGGVTGFYALIMDITRGKKTEEALRQSEALLASALDTAGLGVYEARRPANLVAIDDRIRAITGIPQEEEGRVFEFWAERLHPDDRHGVLDLSRRLLDGSLDRAAAEYRFLHPQRGWLWLNHRVWVAEREAGGGVREVGLIQDVTQARRAQEALRASEERLRALVTTASDAIITINKRGVIESVNRAAERMFGYAAADLIGQNVALVMPAPHRERHGDYLANYLRTGVKKFTGSVREVVGLRRDGSTFPAELSVSEINQEGVFTGILRDVSARKELEGEVLQATALEQRRIGQELHDSVGQELTGLGLMADALAQRLASGALSPAEVKLATRVSDGLQRALAQVRALSHGLVPVDVDPEGLRAALEDLAARSGEQSGTPCVFESSGPVQLADAASATHLFRIAQEAVGNALRHGHATRLRLALRGGPGSLTLTVEDDGTGLPEAPADGKGLGLRLMRYRAGLIGGTLAIGPASDAGRGTLVTCVLPRSDDHGCD